VQAGTDGNPAKRLNRSGALREIGVLQMATAHPMEVLLFIKYVNEADYFEAHEVLEGYWHSDRIDFYKGLIQLAVGLYHLHSGNIAGCRRLFMRSKELLAPYAPKFREIDVARILDYLNDCLKKVPNVVEMERDEVRALGVKPIQLWLEDGTPIPDEVPPEYWEHDEDDE
jgi:predicted metal-dependent hydrolase